MKAWGVYDDEIRELAAGVGLKIFCDRITRVGRAYQFRLALGERQEDGRFRFQKFSYHGHRTWVVCWHGYRAFLMSLFGRFPEARVLTGLADFRGREDFLDNYKYTRGVYHRYGGGSDQRGCVCHPEPMRRIERPPELSDWARRWLNQPNVVQAVENYTQAIQYNAYHQGTATTSAHDLSSLLQLPADNTTDH